MAARKNKNRKGIRHDIILEPARKNKIGRKAKTNKVGMPTSKNGICAENKTEVPRRVRPEIKGEQTHIATWNVQDLSMPDKLDKVISEMERFNFKILGMCDTRWKGSGKQETKNGIMYYSGINKQNPKRCYGVALLVDTKTNESVINFTPYSDQVMLLKFSCEDNMLNIIQVCAPPEDEDDKSVEAFYNQLERVLRITKKHEVTIILGGFHAIVGEGAVTPVVGSFGIGTRNKRGDMLVKFCQKHDFSVCNTWYQVNKKSLYTYAPEKTQVDYILINRRRRFHQKYVRAFAGANISSNYQPLQVRIFTDFKKADKIVMSLKLFKKENEYKRTAELDGDSDESNSSTTEEDDDTKNTSTEDVKENWYD